MIPQNLERLRENIKNAETEDLLDRITFYRAGMEENAITLIEAELRSRGVLDEQIEKHRDEYGTVIWEGEPPIALMCGLCSRPAVEEQTKWHRLLRVIPLFPRRMAYCPKHRPKADAD